MKKGKKTALNKVRDLEKNSPLADGEEYIYAIYHPRISVPWYIGRTKNLLIRYRTHLLSLTSSNRWMVKAMLTGNYPDVTILSTVRSEDADAVEMMYIDRALRDGIPLSNVHGSMQWDRGQLRELERHAALNSLGV